MNDRSHHHKFRHHSPTTSAFSSVASSHVSHFSLIISQFSLTIVAPELNERKPPYLKEHLSLSKQRYHGSFSANVLRYPEIDHVSLQRRKHELADDCVHFACSHCCCHGFDKNSSLLPRNIAVGFHLVAHEVSKNCLSLLAIGC